MSKKTKILLVFIVLLLLAINVSIAKAAPPSFLHIEVLEVIGGVGAEPFIASGQAVDDGLVCAAGTVEDIGFSSNPPSGPIQKMWATKQFYCGDGTGTFDVYLNIKLDLTTHDTTAQWKVIGGTSAYQNLKGGGKLVGLSNYPTPTILDIYDGKVH